MQHIFGIILLVSSIRFQEEAVEVSAEITQIESYRDDYKDIIYCFKSENIWTNPEPVITLGSEVRVYVDGNDFSKYYVDIQGVLQGRIVDYT